MPISISHKFPFQQNTILIQINFSSQLPDPPRQPDTHRLSSETNTEAKKNSPKKQNLLSILLLLLQRNTKVPTVRPEKLGQQTVCSSQVWDTSFPSPPIPTTENRCGVDIRDFQTKRPPAAAKVSWRWREKEPMRRSQTIDYLYAQGSGPIVSKPEGRGAVEG